MVWSLQRKVSKKSGCEDSSGQISTNEISNRAAPNSATMNVSTPSTVGTQSCQNEETDTPPAYSPGMAESTDPTAVENEDKPPMAEDTIAQKITRLLREKDELLESEEEEKYAVDEAWLERCEAWNRFQESGMTKGEDEYHRTAVAWKKVRNVRERTKLRVRRIELDIKALRKQSVEMVS